MGLVRTFAEAREQIYWLRINNIEEQLGHIEIMCRDYHKEGNGENTLPAIISGLESIMTPLEDVYGFVVSVPRQRFTQVP